MKKLFSLLLILALCLSLFPAAALADGPKGADAPGGPENEETTPPSPPQAPETHPRPLSGEAGSDPDALPPFADEPGDVAASGECGGNLTWTLDEDGTLTISGTGEMPDWGRFDPPPWASETALSKRSDSCLG